MAIIRLTGCLLVLFLFPLVIWSQSNTHSLDLRRISEPIVLDGQLNESTWRSAQKAAQFFQQQPYDTSYAVTRTEAMVAYDDLNLYVAAICYDPDPSNFIVQSLKRDFSYPVTDAFAIYLDPFMDQTNGFSFAVSPLGVQREGLLQNGGTFGVTTNWDNRWFSEVKIYADRWEVEIKIPFKTLRYKEGIDQWGINFSRNNLKENENSVWSPVPRNLNVAALAFTGVMHWEEAPPKAGSNISLIPYTLGSYQADYENNTESFKPNAGLDAKIAVTSALNLDLTVNPDFSQVEVDRQVTNLSRFSLFFPERRQFFTENSDLFSSFGFSRIRPFFSRRIGLASGQAVPILGGARLSGKLSKKWRMGLLNMQTEGVSDLQLAPQNYTAAALQRQVLANSYVTGIFINRQSFSGNRPSSNDFVRLGGLQFNYASSDNRWRGKVFYLRSWDADNFKRKASHAVWTRYQDQFWTIDYNHEWVDENFNGEVGFVPRSRYLRWEQFIRRQFYPKNDKVIWHGPRAYFSYFWDNQNFKSLDRQTRFQYNFQFKNRSELQFSAEDWYVFLRNPFDPSRSGADELPDSVGYQWRQIGLQYQSDFRKRFNYNAFANYGSYYTGNRLQFGGELNYRAQPWGVFSLVFEQNQIALPDTTVNLSLISPRFEFAFSRNVFFTTFLQFNTQSKNFNINARLQWRFKPMSDLFLVLTDNYLTEDYSVRNRAIVLKLNYWLTL